MKKTILKKTNEKKATVKTALIMMIKIKNTLSKIMSKIEVTSYQQCNKISKPHHIEIYNAHLNVLNLPNKNKTIRL